MRIARALSWERKPQTSREAVSPGQAHTAAANTTLESPPCVASKTVAEDEQENTIFHRVARTLSWDRKPRSGDAAPSSSGTSAECKESNTVCSSNSTRAGSAAASIGVVEAQSQEDDSIFHHLARALSWDRKPRAGNASRSADPDSKPSASRGDTARTSNDAQEEDTIFHQLARALSWERKPRACRAACLNTESYSPGPGARVREERSLSKTSDVHTASTESQEEDTFAQQVSRMISGEGLSRSDSPDAKSHPKSPEKSSAKTHSVPPIPMKTNSVSRRAEEKLNSQEDDSLLHQIVRTFSWDKKPRSSHATRPPPPSASSAGGKAFENPR